MHQDTAIAGGSGERREAAWGLVRRWRTASPPMRTFVVFNLALLAWYLVRPGEDTYFIWGVVVGGIVAPAISIAWSLIAWRRLVASGHRRRALAALLLAAGTGMFFVGNTCYYYLSVLLGVAGTPTLADLFFLLSYPFLILAVLLLPASGAGSATGGDGNSAPGEIEGEPLGGGVRLLDAMLAAAAVAAVSWHFLLAPLLSVQHAGNLAGVVNTVYPVLDVIVLACLLATASRRRHCPRSNLLAAGLAVVAVTDSLYAHGLLHGSYQNGALLDLGWSAGYMLVGLATWAMAQVASDAASPDLARAEVAAPNTVTASALARRRRVQACLVAVLPFAAFALLAGLAFSTLTDPSDAVGALRRGGGVVGFLAIAALLLVRQTLVIRQNAGLNDRLRDAIVQLRQGHTSLAAAVDTLRESEERFRVASQCAGDLIYELDLPTGALVWYGDVDRLLGYAPGEFPRTLRAWDAAIHPDDRQRATEALNRHVNTGERFDIEYRIARADGHYLHWTDRGRAITDKDGKPSRMIGAVADITATKAAQDRLRHDSLHDALTGLPNRALFFDRVDRCIERARRARHDGQRSAAAATAARHFAVLFLDLDRFKLINDSLGHAAGDRLLATVAQRLEACLRATDSVARPGGDAADTACEIGNTVNEVVGIGVHGGVGGGNHRTLARLGGDEFTILLEGLAARDDAEAVAARVLAALAEPINCDGHEVFANASVGVVHGSAHYRDARDLLRDADVAMYRAKAAGRGRFAVFDARMHTEAVARLKLEGDLRRAIERRELTLMYQPLISLRTGEIAGVEALARWRKTDGSLTSPAEFIPVAEDTGLIVPLGSWVMQEACRQMREWRDAHGAAFGAMTVAVNVAGRQLADADALLTVVHDALAASNLPPEVLKLEITEGTMMEPDAATGVLARLRNANIALHMDDFGTGYSSLSRLHSFPIQGLKIDRSFIQETAGRHTSIALLQSIVALSHHLGVQVVAEGVETPEQVALLQTLECDFAQGYHFAKPLTAEEMVTFVLSRREQSAAA